MKGRAANVESKRKGSLTLEKSHPVPGARPGTLRIPPSADPPRLKTFLIHPENVEESEPENVRQAAALRREGHFLWLDVQGIGDEQVLLELGDVFGVHPLALEDIVNVPQRPTSQVFAEHHMILLGALRPGSTVGRIRFEQVTLLVGRDYVVSVQEAHGDQLEPVRERLRQGGPNIRRSGPDYLAYALIDAAVDAYYGPIEECGEELEELDELVLLRPTLEVQRRIHGIKKELLVMRRSVWPMREMINGLIRDDSAFIGESARLFLRDCYDHSVQLLEVIDTFREHVSSLTSTYLTALGNRTNDVMKVLTIMASIFIPLSFLAGLYGMNFDHMPELHWKWGYPALLSFMATVGLGLLLLFVRLGWIGRRGSGGES